MSDARTATPDKIRQTDMAFWRDIIAEYQQPNARRASWQLVNTLGSYVIVWALMYGALQISWWLTLPLAALAGGLLIRVFIIFHDCGHGSFFKSRKANIFWGYLTGMLTFTPFEHWAWQHAIHHASNADLDRRGVGDIWTMTVEEYLQASRWKRFSYRLARNPLLLFVIAPLAMFMILHRIPSTKATARERRSVWLMNLLLLGMVSVGMLVFGGLPYLILQVIVMGIAGTGGIWLFYVQHQFEDVYWERSGDWNYTEAALKGSSYYKLPKVLQWFSGNIGFHHIHHLSPRIPNYNLERCHESETVFHDVKHITVLTSLKSLTYRLWDESSRKLVSFRYVKTLRKQMQQQARLAAAAAHDVKEAVAHKAQDMKDAVAHRAHDVSTAVAETAQKVADSAGHAADGPDVARGGGSV